MPSGPLYFPHLLSPTRTPSGPPPIPALDPPNDPQPIPRGTPPGTPNRGFYDGPAKLGLMLLAVRDGVTATSDTHRVPGRTLTRWLEDYGTVAGVRAWLEAETHGAFLRFEQAVYRKAIAAMDAPTTNKEELWLTVRKLIEARALVPAQAAAAQPVAAGAAAQATVTVQIKDESGKVEQIELERPPDSEEK